MGAPRLAPAATAVLETVSGSLDRVVDELDRALALETGERDNMGRARGALASLREQVARAAGAAHVVVDSYGAARD
jgi:hypothetical protein